MLNIGSKLKVLSLAAVLTLAPVAPTTYALANGFPSETPVGQTDVSSSNIQAGTDVVGEIIQQQQDQVNLNHGTGVTTIDSDAGTGAILGEIASELQVERTISETMDQPWVQALVSVVSTLISIMVVVIILWMSLGTALDIMYIMVPPTRKFLSPDQGNQGRGGPGGGMGMPGMGGQPQGGGGGSAVAQFISLEARDLVQKSEAAASGSGMPGMGGGMGMPGMGGPQQSAPSPKPPIKAYIGLRAKAFIWLMIAIVMLLFNTFIFDIGTQIANILIYLIVTIFDIILTIF